MKLCTRRGCRRDSLGNAISNAARFTNYTYLASGASNVADDLVGWLSASLDNPMVMRFCTPPTLRLTLALEGHVCTPACACVNLGGLRGSPRVAGERVRIPEPFCDCKSSHRAWVLCRLLSSSEQKACCRVALTRDGKRGPFCPARWDSRLHPDQVRLDLFSSHLIEFVLI